VAADIETALVIHDLFRALGFSDFTVRLNNRLVLTGLLERLELAGQSTAVLRALDKFGKIGPEAVAAEMVSTARATPEQARQLLRLAEIAGDNDAVLRQADALVAGSETGQAGVAKLKELLDGATAAGAPAARFRLDLSIARGLDYYTGTVFETYLDALPAIGSVCSGGRYDNLAGLFTAQELPGIGASLGLDRLLAAMEELGMVEKISTPAPVFIPYFEPDRLHDYLRLAASLRAAGIGVEVFPDPKKLGQQLKYADRRGFRVALIAGSNEFQSGVCQVKDLQTGGKQDVPLEPDGASLIAAVKSILGE
jgi:histidyl-tRNA synthetase